MTQITTKHTTGQVKKRDIRDYQQQLDKLRGYPYQLLNPMIHIKADGSGRITNESANGMSYELVAFGPNEDIDALFQMIFEWDWSA